MRAVTRIVNLDGGVNLTVQATPRLPGDISITTTYRAETIPEHLIEAEIRDLLHDNGVHTFELERLGSSVSKVLYYYTNFTRRTVDVVFIEDDTVFNLQTKWLALVTEKN